MNKDRLKGKAKELEGRLTGDESREAEGRIQNSWGEKKEEADRAWEGLKDKAGAEYNERAREKERKEKARE